MSLKLQTSNITNKNDPRSINSRVFIGNLNTAVVKKSDVETIFGQYGKVVGCSVHKGYAFVQYTNERTARVAVAGENRRVLAGQTLDINMAGEPKPNRPKGVKRPSSTLYSTSYDFAYDYFRDDFYERMHEYSSRPSLVPRAIPVKRPRVIVPVLRRAKSGIPLKLMSRSTTVAKNATKLKLKSNELQRIKLELTQIKSNIDSLLGRLEEIAKEKVGHTETRKKADEGRTELSHGDSASETAETVTEEPFEVDETNAADLEQGEAAGDNDCEDEMIHHSQLTHLHLYGPMVTGQTQSGSNPGPGDREAAQSARDALLSPRSPSSTRWEGEHHVPHLRSQSQSRGNVRIEDCKPVVLSR